MSYEETESTGIPTRAIHESYLELQGGLQQYRAAQDGTGHAEQAHGTLQNAVLTFYELLRPHMKHETGVRDYYDGAPPDYPGDGSPPDPDDGKGVLQVQTHRSVVEPNKLDLAAAGASDLTELERLKQWHDAVGLNGSARVVGVKVGEAPVMTVQRYECGLRKLDNWRTTYRTEYQRKGGFMEDKRQETTVRQRVPVDRLTRAARELIEVADKLGALSDFDASTNYTRITDEDIEEIEEWRQANLDQ